MLPTLVFTAAQPGLLNMNGSFAGELSAEAPLIRPASSHGALLLDYRPMDDAHRPMARRIVFSGGMPLAESIEAAPGISCVVWPGGIIEIALSPMEYLPDRQVFSRGGFSFLLEGGPEPSLQCEGKHFCTLPEGAEMPELRNLRDGLALLGKCRDGRYLVTANARMQGVTGFLRAKELEAQEDGQIRALIVTGDIAGHAAREEWRLTPAGLELLSSIPVWEHGSPRRPQTPEETAIAAIEAAMAGLYDEAENYLAPSLRGFASLRSVSGDFDLCVRLKFPLPGLEDCVGLLKLEGGNLAKVSPLRFRAIPSNRADFPFLLDALDFA